MCLDGQMRLIKDALIARGTLVEVPAYPRMVAEAALRHNAHSIVLCHNHPGGSVVPSRQDVEMTRVLLQLLQSIDVYLADHIIVAQGRALSMVNAGLSNRKRNARTCIPACGFLHRGCDTRQAGKEDGGRVTHAKEKNGRQACLAASMRAGMACDCGRGVLRRADWTGVLLGG